MNLSSSRRRLDALADRYAHISSNGLRVTKRTSQRITLAWPENEMDVVTFTDSKVSCLDMETELDAQGNWFIVQMRKMEDDSSAWETIYKGYGLRCEVDSLDPDSLILFRLKRNGEKHWGSEIIASTDPPQASGEDLNRAVEMNSEYLVTRILGNTPHGHLKKILGAHDKNGMTPLMVACHKGNQTITKMLLSCGSRVNDASTGVNRTPLMFACIVGKLPVVQLLDQHGCDWRIKDKSGCNAMHHAINGGNLAIVRLAFAKLEKALAFEPDHCGWTPIMRAVILSDSLDIVKFLIGKGADPNDVDRTNSKSVLMAAILSKKVNFVKFLLEWGADPFYKNLNGKNCYDVALGQGYRELATIIRQHMAALQPSSKFLLSTLSNFQNNNLDIENVNLSGHSSRKVTSAKVSVTSITEEGTDTLLENSQHNLHEDLPSDIQEPKSKRLVAAMQKRMAAKSEEAPLRSVSSTLETKYLMLPQGKR